MNTQQTAYALALATHEATVAEARAKHPAEPTLDIATPEGDEAWDAFVLAQETIDAEHGVYASRDLLRAAEDDLIAWGRTISTVVVSGVDVDSMAKSAFRWKLIDLLFRVDTNTIPKTTRGARALARRAGIAL